MNMINKVILSVVALQFHGYSSEHSDLSGDMQELFKEQSNSKSVSIIDPTGDPAKSIIDFNSDDEIVGSTIDSEGYTAPLTLGEQKEMLKHRYPAA
jgi:hypothetical protein